MLPSTESSERLASAPRGQRGMNSRPESLPRLGTAGGTSHGEPAGAAAFSSAGAGRPVRVE